MCSSLLCLSKRRQGFAIAGFDLEPILQCDLSGLAELRHNFQQIAE